MSQCYSDESCSVSYSVVAISQCYIVLRVSYESVTSQVTVLRVSAHRGHAGVSNFGAPMKYKGFDSQFPHPRGKILRQIP